jgi:hypothetical protein
MADIYTNKGEELTADYIDGTASAPTNWYIGWGTGAGTASKTDTTLFTEVGTRVAATESQPTASQNRFVATLTASGAQTITNAGVFDASTSGNMLLKSDFTAVPLADGETIEFTFTLSWN